LQTGQKHHNLLQNRQKHHNLLQNRQKHHNLLQNRQKHHNLLQNRQKFIIFPQKHHNLLQTHQIYQKFIIFRQKLIKNSLFFDKNTVKINRFRPQFPHPPRASHFHQHSTAFFRLPIFIKFHAVIFFIKFHAVIFFIKFHAVIFFIKKNTSFVRGTSAVLLPHPRPSPRSSTSQHHPTSTWESSPGNKNLISTSKF